ncbi:MAG: ATP-dependent DNA helicase, partial [Aquificota bacterium]
PLVAARSRWYQEQGKDPFTDYLLPEAVLVFRQGFGRLIRTKEDRGVVYLLDSRVLDKGYGRVFLSSLPPGVKMDVVE